MAAIKGFSVKITIEIIKIAKDTIYAPVSPNKECRTLPNMPPRIPPLKLLLADSR